MEKEAANHCLSLFIKFQNDLEDPTQDENSNDTVIDVPYSEFVNDPNANNIEV